MKLKELVEKYGEYTVPQELIEKLEPPKPKSVWDLEKGDNFACVNSFGDTSGRYQWDGTHSDEELRSVGNAFLTKEEAEKDVERRKVETLLIKHGGRRWFNENSENFYIYYDMDVIDCTNTYEIHYQGSIYFDTEEQAEKAIEQIGEERIKKALFEVKE